MALTELPWPVTSFSVLLQHMLDTHLLARLTQEAVLLQIRDVHLLNPFFPNKLMQWFCMSADSTARSSSRYSRERRCCKSIVMGSPSGEARPCLDRWTRLLSVQSSGWCLQESHTLPWISCPRSGSPQCLLCQCRFLLPPSENSRK